MQKGTIENGSHVISCESVCFGVYQKRGVSGSDCAVRFNEGRLQFAHFLHGGWADAVVLGHNVTTW